MKKSFYPSLIVAASSFVILSGFAGCDRPRTNDMTLGAATNAGLTVKDSNADKPAFIVIYERVDGKPGTVLAHSDLLSAGKPIPTFTIPFASTPGTTYLAMMREDNGDGAFDDNADVPATDKYNGDVIQESFTVPAENAPAARPSTASDTSSDSLTLGPVAGGAVTVTSAVLSRPGFVVVYHTVDGDPREVVGKSALLPAGESTNLTIPLGGKGPYAAMLRADNGDGKLDEGTDDPVNGKDGQTVMKSF